MLKRLEVYADAGLLGFVSSVIVFMLLAMGPGRLMVRFFGEGLGGAISMIGPSVLVGTAIAVWAAWMLHHKTTREPMDRDVSVSMSWFALIAFVIAAALVATWMAWGDTTIAMGIVATVILLALGIWLVVDAVIDIFKTREHITIDIVRVLTLGLLIASLVASLLSPSTPGADADIAPYVVLGGAYMTLVALLTNGFDELVSWRSRTHATQVPLAPSV